MEFHERLRELRIESGLSQYEVAEKIDVAKSTYSLYENGKRLPDVFKIKKIIAALGTTGDELLQISFNKQSNSHSQKANEIAKKYDNLDSHGKKVIDTLIDEELVRVEFEKQNTIPFKYSIQEYDLPVSAGTGQYLDYTCCAITELGYEPPRGAEFIVKVSGDSMEPTYFDGDRLFISTKAELFFGDIGIFNVDGSAYIKEYGKNGLISHNEKYPLIQSENVKCIGKVIGKVEE